ncbi:hypothetical protein ACLB2K_014819 [Fragaria x ananassa]
MLPREVSHASQFTSPSWQSLLRGPVRLTFLAKSPTRTSSPHLNEHKGKGKWWLEGRGTRIFCSPVTTLDVLTTRHLQSDDGDKKQKSEDHVEDDKFTDTVVSLSSGIDVKGVATEPCRKEEGNSQVIVKASCLAEHFVMTMSFLSAEKAGMDVDPRYLIPIKDSKYMCTKNWAKFAFDKLVEGVLSFQRTEVGLEVVPLLFLQLFYLDVVRNDMIFEKKMLKPVMTWEVTDVKRVVDMVEGLGG